MCGVTGFVDRGRRLRADELDPIVRRMASTLHHRGPDDGGTWVDPEAGVALGHRRLSIIDPSPDGHQPMMSAGGRYVLTYNGEIYNFKAIRAELEGRGEGFKGRSDTEVLVRAIEHWGLDAALPRLNGMFAFALWDRHRRELHLVRDRMGEKPMYYGWSGGTFLFGSELKALRAHPGFAAEVDRDSIALYLRHNCIPAPHSIYVGIAKLPPGCMTTLSADDRPGHQPPVVPWWRLRDVVEAGTAAPLEGSPDEVADELERVLLDAVGLQMHADVPLGAFLSGGVDSSLIVALMQAQSSARVKTFTVGFAEAAYDESADAAKVASHLGTDHLELRVTAADAQGVIPSLAALYDEPFADSSQIPTLLVSRLTRGHVTVSLSGDGGDELFGGYNRYTWCPAIWRRMRGIPAPVRRASAAILSAVPPSTWDNVFARTSRFMPEHLRVRTPGPRVHKLAEVLPARGIDEMYLTLSSHWKDPGGLVAGGREPPTLITDSGSWPALDDPVARMMYLDGVTYLPDDILAKVDRASMGVSLEARVPYLDHRVVETAWRIPLDLRIHGGEGKWILRQVLYRHVPPALVDRPKAGFGLPVGAWLRGPLRPWAEELLDERRLRSQGLLDAAPVRRLWSRHLSGRTDSPHHLWDILVLQAWLDAA